MLSERGVTDWLQYDLQDMLYSKDMIIYMKHANGAQVTTNMTVDLQKKIKKKGNEIAKSRGDEHMD